MILCSEEEEEEEEEVIKNVFIISLNTKITDLRLQLVNSLKT